MEIIETQQPTIEQLVTISRHQYELKRIDPKNFLAGLVNINLKRGHRDGRIKYDERFTWLYDDRFENYLRDLEKEIALIEYEFKGRKEH